KVGIVPSFLVGHLPRLRFNLNSTRKYCSCFLRLWML
ncbi:hypothetical protein Csa_023883, partial [Cucumis sativus]